jgi:hypothetical protein
LIVAVGASSCGNEHQLDRVQKAPDLFQQERLFYREETDAIIHVIDEPDLPSVLLTQDEGRIYLGIYQAGTGVPILTMSDNNEDGLFDQLTYSTVSQTGNVTAVVEDYGMDGQPDLVLNVADKRGKLLYEGKWRQIKGFGSSSVTIEADGDIRELSDVIGEMRGE